MKFTFDITTLLHNNLDAKYTPMKTQQPSFFADCFYSKIKGYMVILLIYHMSTQRKLNMFKNLPNFNSPKAF